MRMKRYILPDLAATIVDEVKGTIPEVFHVNAIHRIAAGIYSDHERLCARNILCDGDKRKMYGRERSNRVKERKKSKRTVG